MTAMMSFHTEKCSHLACAHAAYAGCPLHCSRVGRLPASYSLYSSLSI